jgi:hypothetical protein
MLAKHQIIPPFTLNKNQNSSQPLPHTATPDTKIGNSTVTSDTGDRQLHAGHPRLATPWTTRRSRTRWVVPSALLGPKVGRGWPRGYPRPMGRQRGHPRGLGVAFGPTLDPSRAGPMATPSPARPPQALRCHPRGLGLARTWGWPSGQPFCPGRLRFCRPRSTPTPTPTPTPTAGPLVATPVVVAVVAGWVG